MLRWGGLVPGGMGKNLHRCNRQTHIELADLCDLAPKHSGGKESSL